MWCALAGGKVSDAAARREAQLTATVAALQRTLDRARREAETAVSSAKYAQVTASATNPAGYPDCIRHCNPHLTFSKVLQQGLSHCTWRLQQGCFKQHQEMRVSSPENLGIPSLHYLMLQVCVHLPS